MTAPLREAHNNAPRIGLGRRVRLALADLDGSRPGTPQWVAAVDALLRALAEGHERVITEPETPNGGLAAPLTAKGSEALGEP